MTAKCMPYWGDACDSIGFEQTDTPVTNTLKVQTGLTDGNVEVSFCSTWAQAGASHSTDGALVLSRVDAEALAGVLVPGMMVPSEMPTLRRARLEQPPFDLGDRRFFVVEPPSDDRLAELSAQVARANTAMEELHVRAALIAAGWLPPERLEAIAASWDRIGYGNVAIGGDVGAQLRQEFKS